MVGEASPAAKVMTRLFIFGTDAQFATQRSAMSDGSAVAMFGLYSFPLTYDIPRPFHMCMMNSMSTT